MNAARHTADLPTTLPAFAAMFPDEATCEAYLMRVRWPDGFICPKCRATKGYPVAGRGVMECPQGHQTSATAGTIMHRSKQPLTTWFYGAFLISTLTPGISAVQFQKQLGLTRYETAFQLLHKLRAGLVDPARTPLHGEVEVDELFVGGKEEGRPGRGAESKALVICAVEITRYVVPSKTDPNAGVQKSRAGRLRMSVIQDASAETLLPWIQSNIVPGSTIYTDGWAGYSGLARLGYNHQRIRQSHRGVKTGVYLPLVHLLISNLKRELLGTYKGAWRRQHLPAYLNEFVYRFNRRFWRGPAFLRVLGLATTATRWPEYKTLYATKAAPAEGLRRWVHPNPRVKVTDAAVEAIFADLLDAAQGELHAWILNHEKAVRRAIRRSCERG